MLSCFVTPQATSASFPTLIGSCRATRIAVTIAALHTLGDVGIKERGVETGHTPTPSHCQANVTEDGGRFGGGGGG